MSENIKVTMAKGDGIGPEIMNATLKILKAAEVKIDFEEIKIGEDLYKKGHETGMEDSAFESIERTKVFLKAPITTPQGGGYRSLNVTTRKAFGLFANVRPCVSYHPFVETNHPKMDLVVIRENEEDLYAGIEHRQTDEVYQCLKLISRPGCEKIVRYAFEYAIQNNRKKVTAISKDNIMKLTDGLFHKVFDEISEEYPYIETDHIIVDIGAARIANRPEDFDVIVTLNLYGDIISDIAAEITGSVGLAGSSNIGENYAMFEAIHGSAPDIAGQGIANPSGLLLGSIMMLNHLNMPEKASLVHNALLRTIEEGIHTGDIYRDDISKRKVGTEEFTEAVIQRLGKDPETIPKKVYKEKPKGAKKYVSVCGMADKQIEGIDIFLHWCNGTPDDLGSIINNINTKDLQLEKISNRGQDVYPSGNPETHCSDHWRCRFLSESDNALINNDLIELQKVLLDNDLDVIKTENLYTFDGEKGFSD